jgi:hypothetical protein
MLFSSRKEAPSDQSLRKQSCQAIDFQDLSTTKVTVDNIVIKRKNDLGVRGDP